MRGSGDDSRLSWRQLKDSDDIMSESPLTPDTGASPACAVDLTLSDNAPDNEDSADGDRHALCSEHRWKQSRVFSVLFSAMASALAWAVQTGYSTPTLLHLGMNPDTVGLAWLAGPVSGIVVQPFIGGLSDQCRSRFGRRRPFIAGAAISTAASLILFSQAERIGDGLISSGPLRENLCLGISVVVFCILDCSINAIMAPTRAIICDVVPKLQQAEASAFFSIHEGLGRALGYLIGSLNLERALPFLGGELQVVFLGAALLILVLCSITCILASEDRKFDDGVDGSSSAAVQASLSGTLWLSFAALPRLPIVVRRAFLIQFCNSFAWFSFMVYGTDYFGQHINKGLPSAVMGSLARNNYEQGVRIGNMALFAMSLSAAYFAQCLTKVIKRFGMKNVFIVAEVHLMLTLLCMPFVSTIFSAVILYAVLGMTFAATNTIPWMIMTKEVSRMPEAGTFSATFNLSQCLPQIVASLLSGPVLMRTNGRIASIFVMGAIGAGLASCIIVALIEMQPSVAYAQVDENPGETTSALLE